MGERIKVTANKPLSTKENSASNKQKTGFRSQSSHVDQILFLQRTIGNQAVQRLIKSGALQAKLRIGQPGDVYEQEADRVADAVMRMPEPEMQRQVEPEEEEEILQTKPLVDQITPLVQRQVEEEEEEEMLQAKSREDGTSEVTNDLESQINAIKGGGRPLAESERDYFEPRFGANFNRVRVHTDTRAADSAQAVNARAYTIENNIIFGDRQYNPQTNSGKRLLAHELTHVVQQSGVNKYISFNLNLFNKRGKGINIHEKISNATIQRSWNLTGRSSPGTNCLAFALGLSSAWFPPNPSHPFDERQALARKMRSHGYSPTQGGTFSSGNDKVMLIYDRGSRGPTMQGGDYIANIWKHAIVQRGNGTGDWESQNGIGGDIYDSINTPIQFVNNFHPPVSVGSQPAGVSLPLNLLNRIVRWTNHFEYWIKQI